MLLPGGAIADETTSKGVVMVEEADPDMRAAIRQARSSLDEFLSLAASPRPGMEGFKVKVMLTQGEHSEHVWVIPFSVKGGAFSGTLANEPRFITTVKHGQEVRFARTQISDWGYVQNGRQVGSFTVCAMFKKMPREQADYYRKNHGFAC